MPAMKVSFGGKNRRGGGSSSIKAVYGKNYRRFQRAMGATAKEMATRIKQQGDADMQKAGKFGSRWTAAFKSVARLQGGVKYLIQTTHAIPYYTVFQYGATIRGKPLLWIPLSFAQDAQKVMARNFPGGLFRVDRKGGKAPLLLSRKTGEPKYFGKTKVRIPKKFHLVEICRKVARQAKTIYKGKYRDAKP